jgi:hypothetical protein
LKALPLVALGVLTVFGSGIVPASAQGLSAGVMSPAYGSAWAAKQRNTRNAEAIASAQSDSDRAASAKMARRDVQMYPSTAHNR